MVSSYRPSPIKRRRTSAEIARLEDAIYETVEADRPMTVRGVFYRLVSLGLIAKDEKEYKNVAQRLVLKLRRAGDLPYEWIADGTRWMIKPRTFSSAEAALRNTAETYRRALWDDADAYIEVWTEKDAIAGILHDVTDEWDVPLMVARGFSSETFLHTTAQTIKSIGKPTFLYHFGDHDPSGVAAARDIKRRLRGFAPECSITFTRIAVTPEQIDKWNLPTRPTKRSTHSRGFTGKSVEVDAIPPATLRQLVYDCIERHVDHQQLAVLEEAEQSERELLLKMVGAS